MYIKKCPKCGRLPKITRNALYKFNQKHCIIHCPNYCTVMKPLNEINNINVYKNKYSDKFLNNWMIVVLTNDNLDDNAIYKIWNEALINWVNK